jgi:UPF0271 protein
MTAIDLSCDLGEASTGAQRLVEFAIWPMISSANVACGGHAGDDATMREAIVLSLRHGVTLGAHPSYPDREGFGRRTMQIPPADLRRALGAQLARFRALASWRGVTLSRVKPHGALYNDAHRSRELAEAVTLAMRDAATGAAIVCSPGSQLAAAAKRAGIPVILEAFGDRRYMPDGSLVPRSDPRALLLDPEEAATQALTLAREARVIAIDGSAIDVPFQTLCVHADMERSLERLAEIRRVLGVSGFVG